MNYEIKRYYHDMNRNSHFHACFEILISLNNTGRFFVHEKAYQMEKGMIILLDTYEIHRCFCPDNKKNDRIVVHFPKKALFEMNTKTTTIDKMFVDAPLFLQTSEEELSNIVKHLEKINEPLKFDFGRDIEHALIFKRFLFEIARLINSYDTDWHEQKIQLDERVNMTLRYVKENYASDLSLETLSEAVYTSKSRLSQLFKQETGMTIGDYIITYRLQCAEEMLREGFPAKYVRHSTGFRSDTHFYRIFKSKIGYTPSEYVKRMQLNP